MRRATQAVLALAFACLAVPGAQAAPDANGDVLAIEVAGHFVPRGDLDPISMRLTVVFGRAAGQADETPATVRITGTFNDKGEAVPITITGTAMFGAPVAGAAVAPLIIKGNFVGGGGSAAVIVSGDIVATFPQGGAASLVIVGHVAIEGAPRLSDFNVEVANANNSNDNPFGAALGKLLPPAKGN